MYLGRLVDQGAESNHSSYCARISFGGFMNSAEQVSDSITRCQDQAAELSNKRWIFSTTDLNIANEWKTKGRDPNDIESLLDLLPNGLSIWEYCRDKYPHYSSVTSVLVNRCNEIFCYDYQASERIIIGQNKPCVCYLHFNNCDLCPHQLKEDKGKFILTRFSNMV